MAILLFCRYIVEIVYYLYRKIHSIHYFLYFIKTVYYSDGYRSNIYNLKRLFIGGCIKMMTKYERDLISTIDSLIATVNDKYGNYQIDYMDLYELFNLPEEFMRDSEMDLESGVYNRFNRIAWVKNDITILHDLLTDKNKIMYIDKNLLKKVLHDFTHAIYDKMARIKEVLDEEESVHV